MKTLTFPILAAAIAISACATPPSKIDAAYVSPTVYENMSCKELVAERNRIVIALNEMTGAQQQKATGDAVATGVGIVLFFPVLLFLAAGKDKETQLASLKGNYQALTQAGVKKRCFTQ